MQKITDELIEKFLSGDCTKEEAALVASYLKDHPDEQYLLNEYEEADGETSLPEGYREDMLAYITERTFSGEQPGTVGGQQLGAETGGDGTPRKGRLRHLWKWAAAAAVVIVLVRIWPYVQPATPSTGQQLAAYQAPEVAWIEKYNHGKKDMLLELPDSSKVRLLPGARIRYRKDFGSDSPRDVQVTGKAFFDVAKNVSAPFTVYSDGLQTRVLGTTFAVNANPYSDKIRIRLYTGKVLVSLEGAPDAREQKDYYLSPGEELVFSKSTRDVAINGPAKRAEEPVAKSRPVRPDTISNWYMFNNQRLADVFDQLSAIYNVDIEYSHEDIRNMYFIGKLEKKDSLIEIIQDIALLNHLSVTTLNGKYIIKKGKP